MKTRAIILAAALVAVTATLSLTIASCDGNSTDPSSPGVKNGKGKGGRTLNHSATHTIGIDRVGEGESSVSYDQRMATLTVEEFNEGGLNSVADEPANVWTQTVSGSWPAGGGGGLQLRSLDGLVETSRLDIDQVGGEQTLDVLPTFTGGAASGYTVVLYYCDGSTPTRVPVSNTTIVTIQGANDACCGFVSQLAFFVNTQQGQCIWQLAWNACCCRTVIINGIQYDNVYMVDFEEGQGGGAYPYHEFSEIQVLPRNNGVDGNELRVTSELVTNVP